jgi:predicted MPP superfamily phosphohydrolase
VLSGHSHGHQIDLPLVRRLGPHHPGDRRETGADGAPGSAGVTSIVSRGLGAVCVPLRVRSPAEVVLVELGAAAEARPGAG